MDYAILNYVTKGFTPYLFKKGLFFIHVVKKGTCLLFTKLRRYILDLF
jgi:hypothetical protein